MSLIKNLLSEAISNDEQFDMNDVLSKLKSAEKNEKISKNSTAFALEEIDSVTGESRIVKVHVSRDQANEFEKQLAAALHEFEGKKEIAEILFDLRQKFNIVNVEWPDIPEDEEVEQTLDTGESPAENMVASDQEMPTEIGSTDEDDAKSALHAVIDMMKADAEARKADAEARKAEAEAKTAEQATKASIVKARTEEEILDMEAHYKEKEEKKKEADKLAKLAKYKHDIAQNTPQTSSEEQPSVSMSKLEVTPAEDEEVAVAPTHLKPDANKDGYLRNREFLKYIEHWLNRNIAQD